jgi:hypothetical protein
MARLKFTIDPEGWNTGFAAGEAGKALTACPYPMGSNHHTAH